MARPGDLVAKGPCEHCNKETELRIPEEALPKSTTVQVLPRKEDSELSSRLAKIEQTMNAPAAVAEKPKKERVLPSFVPGYVCKDCGEVHPNKAYSKKAEFRCDTADCQQFSGSDKANCPWCGQKDWLKLEDDVKEMLPEPRTEHSHEDQ